MIKDVYNNNKLFHHREKLVDISNKKIVSPVNFQIDITNKCNNKCSWCFYDIYPLPEFSRKDYLNPNVVKDVLKDFKEVGGQSVEWTGGGEPTIYPYFLEVVEFARSLGLGQAMVTNGKMLQGDIAEAVKDFDWVRVSLNSASAHTYKKVHGNDSYSRVVENIENFADIKNSECVLGASMIVNGDNYKEIPKFTLLVQSFGVDNCRLSLPQTPENEKMFYEIWDEILDQMNESKTYADNDFTVFTNEDRIDTLSHKTKSTRCYYHHLTPSLGANGVVYPCCHFKYLPEFNLGNVNKVSFKDIWFGGKRKDFIDTIGENCKVSCWMNGKNTLADYIIKNPKDVPHLNYP